VIVTRIHQYKNEHHILKYHAFRYFVKLQILIDSLSEPLIYKRLITRLPIPPLYLEDFRIDQIFCIFKSFNDIEPIFQGLSDYSHLKIIPDSLSYPHPETQTSLQSSSGKLYPNTLY
jgi:hypothetical protein